MALGDPASDLGQALTAAGWRQGSLFSATLELASNDLSADNQPRLVSETTGQLFVVISQDCDIAASPAQEPRLEAMVCESLAGDPPPMRNSYRRFLIDRQQGLVADATRKTLVSKALLASLRPQPWPGTEDGLRDLRLWLVRRYERPAVPDRLVEVFDRPVREALRRFARQHPGSWALFNGAARELRVPSLADKEGPYELQLLVLVGEGSLTSDEAAALEEITTAVRNSLDPSIVRLHEEVRPLTAEELSLAEYQATRLVLLDDLTYRGEEIAGAEPTAPA